MSDAFTHLFDDPETLGHEAVPGVDDEGVFCDACHQHPAECLCDDDDYSGEWEE